jgi:alpha-L-fucosidase 2
MIGSDGRLLEWYGEREEMEIRHRHVSHLYGLHPGYEIDPIKAPKLAEAARKTLEVRGDDGTGWSLAWKCNFFARLGDGDHALKLLKTQLRPCGTGDTVYTHGGGSYPSLMCAHPPFQIDGNFGATSGVCEMLLQGDMDTVKLLPALPTEWNDISFKGLCAKGKRKVSLSLRNGKLTECVISGKAPKRILLCGNDVTDMFEINEGKTTLK